jgi:hypothetical protein
MIFVKDKINKYILVLTKEYINLNHYNKGKYKCIMIKITKY